MSRSRSRSRDRKKDRHRDRRSRSRKRSRDKRSRSRDRRRSRSRGRDYKRRDRSYSREKYSRKRDKSYDRQREKSRDRSHERHRDRRRDSRDRHRRHSSSSNERNSKARSTSETSSVKPIIIAASNLKRSKMRKAETNSTEAKVDHRKSFEISNEFSQEGFEQFSRDHGIDFSKIETEEDRQELHAKMEEVLKEHFAAQGKVYPPPKPEIPAVNAATGFANDGSFLEQFKKMQEEYKQQLEEEKRRKAAEDRLKALPLRRRGGGKILKTGIVAKNITTPDPPQPQTSSSTDAFSLYFKELQKYKSASCDGDANTRPLVK